ncbi:MAG: cobalt-precorrin-5B (C(1))-methyltransferase CbiD [Bacteroides sp.]|nr:cobalt-precorrin-5B (C(1))-methyltransferase CbiD [Bacteroides sp.]
MILILGGTTEGRIAVKTLEEAGKPFYYSTKGDEQEVAMHNGIRLQGGMNEAELKDFCRTYDIRLMIDAAHPFAEQLHRTVEQVSVSIDIPVIRFERIYPPRDEKHICWCDDYTDAMHHIRQDGISILLALTGVQSIRKLKPLWKDEDESHCRCLFRILERDSSREIARREGFPEENLCYYHAGEDEQKVLQRLHPYAILTKESGLSGGFCEKVEAAQALNIRIYALRRPETPKAFHVVNGEHGLRRMVEKLLPDYFALHSGLTTGTCATAASLAAAYRLLSESYALPPYTNAFPVVLPNGESIPIDIEPNEQPNGHSAFVIKDAGDDPDITNGMRICAHAAFVETSTIEADALTDYTILLRGGEGIGTVTLPGLGLEVGGPAINETPRRMIISNLKRLLEEWHIPTSIRPLVITLSVPGGADIARRTFNPRIGVQGGISIIGTSGIVKPFSSEAFISSIRKSMEVARATGSARIVINSGAKSEKYLHAYYPVLPLQAFVHYGNFIGDTLKIAAELDIRYITLGLMIGKAVKLAEGHLDTHSKNVTMNKDFVLQLARQVGCSETTLSAIGHITLARELWTILSSEETVAFCHCLTAQCWRHCAPLLPHGELTILMITEEGNIIP